MPNWTGPYLLHEILSKGTYRLSKPNSPFKLQAQKYNMTHFKISLLQLNVPFILTPAPYFSTTVQVDVGIEDEEQQATMLQSNIQGLLNAMSYIQVP